MMMMMMMMMKRSFVRDRVTVATLIPRSTIPLSSLTGGFVPRHRRVRVRRRLYRLDLRDLGLAGVADRNRRSVMACSCNPHG